MFFESARGLAVCTFRFNQLIELVIASFDYLDRIKSRFVKRCRLRFPGSTSKVTLCHTTIFAYLYAIQMRLTPAPRVHADGQIMSGTHSLVYATVLGNGISIRKDIKWDQHHSAPSVYITSSYSRQTADAFQQVVTHRLFPCALHRLIYFGVGDFGETAGLYLLLQPHRFLSRLLVFLAVDFVKFDWISLTPTKSSGFFHHLGFTNSGY